ncbi:hypothetical protein T484DRAFT_1941326 [Baffinella frigidus]|nr:hypothetical protein T484DRAFT_1941326 [Cryptophyta sp. CCMP2293]
MAEDLGGMADDEEEKSMAATRAASSDAESASFTRVRPVNRQAACTTSHSPSLPKDRASRAAAAGEGQSTPPQRTPSKVPSSCL